MNSAIFVRYNSLPEDWKQRDELLQIYFCDRLVSSSLENGKWRIEINCPKKSDYFVDPKISVGLNWWSEKILIEDILFAFQRKSNYQIALNDAWTLYSWSCWLQKQIENHSIPDELIVLHVDDHDDLMSPRIVVEEHKWLDAISRNKFDVFDPKSVSSAILSGAIGMGSYFVPLLYHIPKVHVRHLCATDYSRSRKNIEALEKEYELDTVLAPQKLRPTVKLKPSKELKNSEKEYSIKYRVTNQLDEWLESLPEVPVLLHIDFDYFNNRFNGNSDWGHFDQRFDPSLPEILERVDDLFNFLLSNDIKKRIVDIAFGISPGFFPAEYWKHTTERILQYIENM